MGLDFIKFNCPHCDKRIKVPGKYVGGQGKCPKCHQILKVPLIENVSDQLERPIFRFRCPHCDQKMGVPEQYAGKRTRCKNCKQSIEIPAPEAEETVGSQLLQTSESQDDTTQNIEIQALLPENEPGATAVEQELIVEPVEEIGSESQTFDS
ncbi:MAG: hypothetical protein ACYST2_04670, partial [Planctomycetota bacterium]